MSTGIYIIDEKEQKIATLACLEWEELLNFVQVAKKEQLMHLSSIDYFGYAIFNQEQLEYLRKEILIFKEMSNRDKKVLEIIEKAVQEAQARPFSYLLFEGD